MKGAGWPADDPAALRQWLGSGGAEELGRSQNNWAGLIYRCTSQLRNGRDPAERRAYRDTALAALEAASLRRAKTLLRLIEPGAAYLSGHREPAAREWLSLMPHLP